MAQMRFPALRAGALAAIFTFQLVDAGRIIGTVKSAQSNRPIPGALVAIEAETLAVETGPDGSFAFEALSVGSYTVKVSKKGFETVHRNDVYVAGKGDKHIAIELSPAVVQLQKMTVHATSFRKAPDMASSSKIMNIDEIMRAPGALVDVQRVIQNLPSVASGSDQTNEIIVRGGAPGENLLIMDNIEIPNANQFAEQGSGGGVISLINPMLVKGLTFSAGAPPAQYGGKASSVLDVSLRDGNDKIILGGIDIGIAGVGGHAEGPLWRGSTFMLSATRSFLEFVADYNPIAAVPEFWGGQAKLTQNFENHKLSVNGLYGDNSIDIEDAAEQFYTRGEAISSEGTVYATGLTWRGFWTDRLSSKVVISGVGNSFDRREFTGDRLFFHNVSVEEEQTGKVELAWEFGSRNTILAGARVRRAAFDIRITDEPDTLKTYHFDTAACSDGGNAVAHIMAPTPDSAVTAANGNPLLISRRTHRADVGYKSGGFISATLYPFERLRLVPGMRVDAFDYTNSKNVSPRLGALYSLTDQLDVTAAFGVHYQDPDYIQLAAHPANKDLEAKRAITGIAGAEYLLDAYGIKMIAELFYKRYDNLAVPLSFTRDILSPIDRFARSRQLVSQGKGYSYGFELFAQKKLTDRFFWSAAYSYAISRYNDLRPGHRKEWYPGDYDFGSGITLTGGWKKELHTRDWYKNLKQKIWFKILTPIMPVADRIELSGKWRYLGGRPYTPLTYDTLYQRWYRDINQGINSARFPAYHRLDLRIERRFGFGFLQMIYYFDFQNIYNQDNLWTYINPDFNESYSKIDRCDKRAEAYKKGVREPALQLPFVPAGGIIIGF
ncbi:MAG: TonB-dependent receptor plug domain-containing protein [Chitinivibrionales bacterium]|nr:TonB-dependent receptor plug domain-containing protein [Chitinivibrionales bacterium]